MGSPRPRRAWRNCISSWAWAIRARNTRGRGTTPAFCWSKNWPSAGGRTGRTKKFSARIARAERDGRRVLLCQPQTYMNSSGEAVGALVGFYGSARRKAAGGGGRCGFAAGRDPVAPGRQQRRPSRAGVHRAASGHARVCPAADRHRAPGRRAGDHGLRAGPI